DVAAGDDGELAAEGAVERAGEVAGHERRARAGVEDDEVVAADELVERLGAEGVGLREAVEPGRPVAVDPLHPAEVEGRVGLAFEDVADEGALAPARRLDGRVEPLLVADA